MMQNETPLVLIQLDRLQSLINPVINKLDIIEKRITKKQPNTKGYYRNKDLKDKFGLSPNTIIKYRENNTIPYTTIGDVYLYPISKIDEILNKNSNY